MLSTPARACGIDFGTSNSTVGWMRPGAPTLIPLEDGKVTLPSAVFFNADEDHICFGRAAMGEYLDGYEGRLLRSLKSLLGSSLIDSHTEVQGRKLPFRDLLQVFIAELKRRAESAAGRTFESVVLGRPVHFVDDNPQADQLAQDTLSDIARAIGFKDISFQFEPIAAAFHFEQSLQREALVLIADIGGGTSDFSLVRLSPTRAHLTDRKADLLANCGVHIGGTDFDQALSMAQLMPLLGLGSQMKNGTAVPSSHYFNLATWHTINSCYTRKAKAELQEIYRDAAEREKLARMLHVVEDRAGHWLALQVEATKIALSDVSVHNVTLDRLSAEARAFTHTISRMQLDAAIAPLVARVEHTVAELVAQANLTHTQIDTIFFTGGSSGVPLLRERIAAVLPGAEIVEGDLFGSIGAGLAVEAARRFG